MVVKTVARNVFKLLYDVLPFLTVISGNGCLNGGVNDAMMSCSGMCTLGVRPF